MIWNLDKVKNSNPHPAPGWDRGKGTGEAGLGVGEGSGGVRALVVWLSRMMRRGDHWLRRFMPQGQGGAIIPRHVVARRTWHGFEYKMTTIRPPPPPTLASFLTIFLISNEVVLLAKSYLISFRNVSRFSGQGGSNFFLEWYLFLFTMSTPMFSSHVTYSLV